MPRYGLRVSRARNVARRPKDPVVVCIWSALDLNAASTGVGFVKPSGHVNVWEAIGLVR